MSEPTEPDLGPYDPPRPVWVREPAVGRQEGDMAWPGFLWEWRQAVEWGVQVWECEVSTEAREPYWTTSGNVIPRKT